MASTAGALEPRYERIAFLGGRRAKGGILTKLRGSRAQSSNAENARRGACRPRDSKNSQSLAFDKIEGTRTCITNAAQLQVDWLSWNRRYVQLSLYSHDVNQLSLGPCSIAAFCGNCSATKYTFVFSPQKTDNPSTPRGSCCRGRSVGKNNTVRAFASLLRRCHSLNCYAAMKGTFTAPRSYRHSKWAV